jgi:Zn-dependent protease with chaperone function
MSRFLATFLTVTLCSAILFGQSPARDAKKEQAIRDRLAAVAPGAVETFRRATVALDDKNYQQAAELYAEVVNQAPQFSPGLRRYAFSIAGLGRTDEALALLQKVVKMDRSPENLAGLAQVLAFPGDKQESTRAQKEQALTLAKEATLSAQSDPDYAFLMGQIALSLNRQTEFREATDILEREYPNNMETHYSNGIRQALDGNWIASEDEIKEARRLGLPAQAAQGLLDSGIHKRAMIWRIVHYGIYLLGAWALGLVVLFVAGKIFSKLTLRHIDGVDPNSVVSSSEVSLRKYYRQLINIAGMYYYISLPFVIVLVLAVAGGIVYGFLVIGSVPIKLVAILVIGALVTVYKMIHSLFVRVKSEEPGRPLTREEAPGLWILTREVAEKLGTRPLDEIRVTTGTDMAVYERGTYRERRSDMSRRTLVLGLGLLPEFDQNPFRAVLAHEYGHLSHRDTAGGDVALRVNQDMIKFAYAMARAGQAVWWNVAFQFLRLYHFLFRRISHGATRLQEVLADRAAARLYGPQQFEEGLRHVIRRGIEFNHIANNEIRQALQAGRGLQNVYSLKMEPDKSVSESIQEAINRPTSEDDTHPSPVDRFRFASRMVFQGQPAASAPVWDLFQDPGSLRDEMNSRIEERVKLATIS